MTHNAEAVVSLLCLAIAPAWSTVQSRPDYTFEDTVAWADIIVIGRVLESPRIGDLDGRFGLKHQIQVDQYVKGHGSPVLLLETANGCFEVQEDGKPDVLCIMGVPEPSVPEAGTVGVVFLSGGHFAPYGPGFLPISHEPAEDIQVMVRWHELLDEDGLRAYEEARQNPELLKYFRALRTVPLSELGGFVAEIEEMARRRHQEPKPHPDSP